LAVREVGWRFPAFGTLWSSRDAARIEIPRANSHRWGGEDRPPPRVVRRRTIMFNHHLHAGSLLFAVALVLAASTLRATSPAAAQDVQGIELCTRESRLDRRTGCLQSNVEYLQQVIAKNALDAQQKLATANREIAAQKEASAAAAREIAALKDALAGVQARLDQLQKARSDRK
jgi:hypothetical protein